MSRKKTYRKKSSARRARKKGQRIYKVKGGWRISSGRYKRANGWSRSGGGVIFEKNRVVTGRVKPRSGLRIDPGEPMSLERIKK